MKQIINNTDICIITKEKCDFTQKGIEVYLQRTIKFVNEKPNGTTYAVRTDMVNYEDIELPLFNKNGTPKIDTATQEQLFETKEQLIWLEQKQDWSSKLYTNTEINGFYEYIKGQIPEGLSKIEQTNFERQLVLLLESQKAPMWKTITGDLWEFRTESHLLKDKA